MLYARKLTLYARKTHIICEENSHYMRGKLTLYARKTHIICEEIVYIKIYNLRLTIRHRSLLATN